MIPTLPRELYERREIEQVLNNALFLRAERKPDGTRTFRLTEGEALETSYGEDLYRQIFDGGREGVDVHPSRFTRN